MQDKWIKRAKTIKPNEFNDKFIMDFSTKWNFLRRLVSIELKKYEKLYRDNKDFKDYVDRYCKNKPFGVNEALRHIQVQLVGRYYKELEESRDEAKRD